MNSKTRIFMIMLILFSFKILGQTEASLDDYIKEGLKNNIVLKQKKISYEKATYALRSATSLFFPSVSFIADYTHGEGGRSISIPVGDLMNPVYQTLNHLTNSNIFPQINNVSENFFPTRFYDAKIRTSMPIVNSDLIFNRQIQDGQLQLKEYEVDLYKRELVKEIKTAYYNFLSSIDAINIYNSVLAVANEAKRVNESLLKNGAGLPVYVLRSESEIENLQSQLLDAETKSDNAKRYLNFLLNRDLNSSINQTADIEMDDQIKLDNFDLELREEVKMLSKGIEINKAFLNMNKFYWLPKVSGFVDLGAQDSNWKYSKDSKYFLFGLQLQVPLFEGFRNNYKIESASLDLHSSELELQQTKNALNLSVSIAKNELLTAIKNYQSSQKQLSAAKSYNKLIEKGYKEGVNSFIETVDARNQLTSATMLVNINKNKVLIAQTNYERETSTTKINY